MATDFITSRRSLLAASAAAGVAASAAPVSAQSTRRTFVLVHGAYHGGWCWRRVADLLEAKGHKVYTPTLTGLGERSHLMSTSVNLDTHIADIVNVFKWEGLENAVLVGHSYAGWPVSGAIEQVLPQVSSIVFLDAFLPVDGETGTDGQSPENRAQVAKAFAAGEASRPAPKAQSFEVADPTDVAWVESKMTPQPIGVTLQAIKLTYARDRVAKKTYIRAKKHPSAAFDKALDGCKKAGGWKIYELDTGHDVMVDKPDVLANILMDIA